MVKGSLSMQIKKMVTKRFTNFTSSQFIHFFFQQLKEARATSKQLTRQLTITLNMFTIEKTKEEITRTTEHEQSIACEKWLMNVTGT